MKKWEHRGRSMTHKVTIAAPPDVVWDAWARPEQISRWFTDGAAGEPVPGSVMTWIFDGFGPGIPYTVVDALPGERFSLGFESGDGRSGLIEITLKQEAGSTIVRLVNSGFLEGGDWDEEYQGISSGWQCALAVLKHHLEEYPGRNKTVGLAKRLGDFDYSALHRLCSSAGAVAEWSGIPEPELTMLADTGREAVLSWPAIGGTVEVKGWRQGHEQVLAIRLLTWTGARLEPAKLLERLSAVLLS